MTHLRLHLLPFILFMATGLTAVALPVDRYFVSAPREVLPLIAGTARLDLLDLHDHKMEAVAENNLGGQAKLLQRTDFFIRLTTSAAGKWQLRLFPQNSGDTLLVVVRSVLASGEQSAISVYHKDWTASSLTIPTPRLGRFIKMDGSSISPFRMQELVTKLNEQPIKVDFTGDDFDIITFAISTEGLSIEDRKDVDDMLEPVRYKMTPLGSIIPYTN